MYIIFYSRRLSPLFCWLRSNHIEASCSNVLYSYCYATTYVCSLGTIFFFQLFYCTLIILPMFYQKAKNCLMDYKSLHKWARTFWGGFGWDNPDHLGTGRMRTLADFIGSHWSFRTQEEINFIREPFNRWGFCVPVHLLSLGSCHWKRHLLGQLLCLLAEHGTEKQKGTPLLSS